MEHRYTVTEDGSSAGAWWDRNTVMPELAWMYDRKRRVLRVTTRDGRSGELRILARTPIDLEAKRSFLPDLALQMTRLPARQTDK